jgi:hypothetical protein
MSGTFGGSAGGRSAGGSSGGHSVTAGRFSERDVKVRVEYAIIEANVVDEGRHSNCANVVEEDQEKE